MMKLLDFSGPSGPLRARLSDGTSPHSTALASAELQAAESRCQGGHFAEALPHLDRAIHAEPENALHYANRSLVHMSLGHVRGFKSALRDAERAVELAPTWHRGYYRKGLALRALRLFKSADETLNRGLELARGSLSGSPSSGGLPGPSTGPLDDAALRASSSGSSYDADRYAHDALYSSAFDTATTVVADFSIAIEETTKLACSEGAGMVDNPQAGVEADEAAEGDVFAQLEAWLAEGSTFPFLYMRRYGEGSRGVHARCDLPPETELLAVGHEYLITVEMGRACSIGKKIAAAGIERDLSAAKHCYLTVFCLQDKRNASSFFSPYYAILPSAYPNMPIFWGQDEIGWLQGSYLTQQIADRKANILADYELICRAAPEMRAYSYDEFCWGRMMVASRNFGIVVDGVRTDALVPYADMLNHYRPRQTRWAFDNRKRQFIITSLQSIHTGQQVMDSYGKKCNSRFLLNYGFAVDHNTDDDIGQNHNEVRLVLAMPSVDDDALHARRLEVGAGLLLEQFDPGNGDGSSSAEDGKAGSLSALSSSVGALALASDAKGSSNNGGSGSGSGSADSGSGGLSGAGVGTVRSSSADRLGGSSPSSFPTQPSNTSPSQGGRVRGSYLASASRALEALDIVDRVIAGGGERVLAGNVPGRDFEGTAVQKGCIVGRAVRIATYYDADSTTEAFSWVRLLHATGAELAGIPPLEDDGDLVRRPIRPQSCASEAAGLRHLARACAAQLAAYPTSYEWDCAELESGKYPYGSNRRNALVLVKGEKEVCRYYMKLADEAAPFLTGAYSRLPVAEVRPMITRRYAGSSDMDRYMRNVVLTLLKRQEDGLTAGGPVGPGGVAPPPVPTRAGAMRYTVSSSS